MNPQTYVALVRLRLAAREFVLVTELSDSGAPDRAGHALEAAAVQYTLTLTEEERTQVLAVDRVERDDETAEACRFCLRAVPAPDAPACCERRREWMVKHNRGPHPVLTPEAIEEFRRKNPEGK